MQRDASLLSGRGAARCGAGVGRERSRGFARCLQRGEPWLEAAPFPQCAHQPPRNILFVLPPHQPRLPLCRFTSTALLRTRSTRCVHWLHPTPPPRPASHVIPALSPKSSSSHQVHGVLGQRAISPAPMTQPPVEQPGGGEGQRTLAALDTTTFSAALGLGGGGVGTSTTVRAAVQVDGRLQGEGAIVGSYRDYQASAPRMYSSSVSVCQSFRCQSCLCVCPTPHHNSLHAY